MSQKWNNIKKTVKRGPQSGIAPDEGISVYLALLPD